MPRTTVQNRTGPLVNSNSKPTASGVDDAQHTDAATEDLLVTDVVDPRPTRVELSRLWLGLHIEVMQYFHGGHETGRCSVKSSLLEVRRRFFWPGQMGNIERWCICCDVCTKRDHMSSINGCFWLPPPPGEPRRQKYFAELPGLTLVRSLNPMIKYRKCTLTPHPSLML